MKLNWSIKMKILFSPSETKFKGGETKKINKNSFIFPELFEERIKVVNLYQTFIDNASNEELEKLFGTKKEDIINYYKGNLLEKEIMKVIERYDGVAFDYLKYSTLKNIEKAYIDENVVIFSNLMGPILAGDMGIPDYKLKQNEKIGDFELEKFYNEKFSNSLTSKIEIEKRLFSLVLSLNSPCFFISQTSVIIPVIGLYKVFSLFLIFFFLSPYKVLPKPLHFFRIMELRTTIKEVMNDIHRESTVKVWCFPREGAEV